MKQFSKISFIKEALDDKFDNKLGEKYKSLKKGILELVDKSMNTEDLVEVQNFMDSYINDPASGKIEGFIEESDIFNFYLKYQSDVDEICNDKEYFKKLPSENNVFSLYDFVIEGTKFGVVESITILMNEIFD